MYIETIISQILNTQNYHYTFRYNSIFKKFNLKHLKLNVFNCIFLKYFAVPYLYYWKEYLCSLWSPKGFTSPFLKDTSEKQTEREGGRERKQGKEGESSGKKE